MIQKTNYMYSKKSDNPEGIPDFPPFMIPQQDDGIKIVESQHHTLFVQDMEPEHKEFKIQDDGEEFTAIREIVPKHKHYTLYISEFAHQSNQLHKILYELRKADEFDTLELRIMSDGGLVSEGITLYNSMRELFNGRSLTFLDSTGFSMGAMLFSLGDERISYEDSSLMFHTFSSGYMGKGQELKSYVDFETTHFDRFFRQKIVSKGFLTNEEYEQMKIGKDFWFDSYEMAKRGICTHVIVSGYRLDNEAFIEYHDQDEDIDSWVINKLTTLMETEDGDDEVVEEVPVTKKVTKKKIVK
jgi:ATP-dependent protease ClpP protease subunit